MSNFNNENEAIKLENITMEFNLHKEKLDSVKEYFIKLVKRDIKRDSFKALDDVSFTVNKGDRVGVLGLNGAGKSTLMKVIAGVFEPTSGRVSKEGVIAPMIELGAGFDNQYTGAENIYLYGAVLGHSRKYMEQRFEEIVEFSELKEFIDVPLKNYSSGMRARLGFSIATMVKPDILILDEVLSVGDAKFKKKSEEKLKSMMDENTTVIFVSHNLGQVRRICNKAMILEKGRMIAYGDIEEVAAKYEEMTK
ncbi:MAG: ABC transporter ATP-binding protein [Lachnospiraceae bacterium]|nr:ABC transporter ATP-binding protein [Lachnospiraceae bacterium]